MLELDQYKFTLNEYRKPLLEVGIHFDIAGKEARIKELSEAMEDQNFWNDVEASNRIMKEMKNLKDTIADFNAIQETFDDIEVMIEMAEEEDDVDLIEEAGESIEQFKKKFEAFRIETLLSGEFDTNNAVINIHSGAGGTESCDWVSMLYRMYQRWANDKGFSVEEFDNQPGDEAGIKSVTFQVNGYHAYGYLKSEHGIHRLVRISPFNANGKRQTSFCSVDVMPEVDDTIEIEIKDDDLKIDTYRSSGAGGQHINKTSSAVRITHLPTGIVVQCQNERSQHMNKDKAMKMLKTKLFMLKQQENMEKMSGIRGEVADNGFGSQIRSYVLQPYTLVKDHRTNCEVGDASRVLDGGIDPFINAYLKMISQSKDSEE
ncbi:peptide chain release factor 2 [Eubacterium ruminantium]|uniref:peptide chain release factor 2 n=1 Tax=Eubacterium ruminantium TaxID=42322 RepID=UPI001568AB6E